MSSEPRKLEAARALELGGQTDAAVKAYVAAGAVEEAARVLAGARRFGEAGRLLLDSLGVEPHDAGTLGPPLRVRALRAASVLAKGGEIRLAADLLGALGDVARAIDLYLERGQQAEAASLARRLGRPERAAEIYAQAGLTYEAGVCFVEADLPQKALEQFQRVPPDHPKHRSACVKAAPLAGSLGALSFAQEQFFARFLATTPNGDDEIEAFQALGRLYADRGFLHDAHDAFEKVLAAAPDDVGAAAQLAHVQAELQPEAPDLELLPDLPEAPDLPDASQMRRAKAPTAVAVWGGAFEIGSVVADRYRLEQRIGAGGMAVVFRASDLDLQEEIALKVFTQAVHDPEAEQRFKRELKLSRQLSNPHIVRLFDIGSYHGIRYISMELLSGSDLRQRMASPLLTREALGYVIQACAGLQAAHDAGVVHRDFKPENCFVTTSGVVKVMDFGIAKLQSAPGLTGTGIIAGTPSYISPEQVSHFSSVTHATDLYSLGVVLYELFSGQVPFSNPEPMKLFMMHMHETPVSPRVHNPAISAALESVILKLLEKDPARRFGSCRELAAALEEIRKSAPS